MSRWRNDVGLALLAQSRIPLPQHSVQHIDLSPSEPSVAVPRQLTGG